MSEASLADWTTREAAIVYQSCTACGARWYFRRGFCPLCGAGEPQAHAASGEGVVYAVTSVCRAATPEAKAHVPYTIVLVDMAEGFRIMGHGAKDLAIGDEVVARFERFTDRLVPYFVKTAE